MAIRSRPWSLCRQGRRLHRSSPGTRRTRPALLTSPVEGGVLAEGGTNGGRWLAPNPFQMPRTANADLRLKKAFILHESWKLTLRGDAFNLFTHNNTTAVNATMYTVCAPNSFFSAL